MSARVRKLTDDEIKAFRFDIAARMASLQRAYEKSSGAEHDRHLLGAVMLCGTFHALPDWVYTALRNLLKDRLQQEPLSIHWLRWLLVIEARREGMTWEAAYKDASKRAAGMPAGGAPSTVKKSYLKVQRIRRKTETGTNLSS